MDGGRGGPGAAYPLALRLRAVQAVVDDGASVSQASAVFGPSRATIISWVEAYKKGGVDAIVPVAPTPPKRGRKPAEQAKRDAVTDLRREHPEYGTRRIRDVLARFEALGVSETEVRRILHEEGLLEERAPQEPAREHGPRRFERAAPNQLWQSDIFTFLLRRQERLYLTAFMDDHSRFIVSHALAHHQRSELVMEAFARGIAEYGAPQEVLTDQGRQYTAWRGETDFERELRRNGIRHVKSRPQHPQTLGKVERFWKTLWEEFLSRTVFSDFADCQRRLALYIDGYNFHRPHQGIEGLVPADRFFQAAPHVREAVKANVAENALRLAMEQEPRKPFYLVGRLGDRDLSIAAAGSALRVQLGGEEPQTIQLPKENDDEKGPTASRRGLETKDPTEQDATPTHTSTTARWAASSPRTPDAELAARAAGPGRHRAAALLDGTERHQWRDPGDGRDRVREHLATDVLPAGGTSAEGDAQGAHSGDGGGADHRARRGVAPENRGPFGEGDATRAGKAPHGSPAVFDQEGSQEWADDDRRARPPAEGAPRIGGRWAQTLALLDDEEPPALRPGAPSGGWDGRFDPDAGWRGRAVEWDRKLTGADAPSDSQIPKSRESRDVGQPEEATDVHQSAALAARADGPIRPGVESPEWAAVGERGGAPGRASTQSLPDADASRADGPHRGALSASERTPPEARRDESTRGREPPPSTADGTAGTPAPGAGAADRESGGGDPRPDLRRAIPRPKVQEIEEEILDPEDVGTR
jgi:transposase InsO family protein